MIISHEACLGVILTRCMPILFYFPLDCCDDLFWPYLPSFDIYLVIVYMFNWFSLLLILELCSCVFRYKVLIFDFAALFRS